MLFNVKKHLNLQLKVQITRQHDKSKLKNTERINNLIVKSKILKCHFKDSSNSKNKKNPPPEKFLILWENGTF